MKNTISFFVLCTITMMSCSRNNIVNSPFLTVLNYISAASFNDTTEAERYIDIEKVFTPYIDDHNVTARQAWINLLKFQYSLGKDKKFINQFPFYKYSVTELINGNTARIIFISKEDEMKKIEYELLFSESKKWKIISIKYNRE